MVLFKGLPSVGSMPNNCKSSWLFCSKPMTTCSDSRVKWHIPYCETCGNMACSETCSWTMVPKNESITGLMRANGFPRAEEVAARRPDLMFECIDDLCWADGWSFTAAWMARNTSIRRALYVDAPACFFNRALKALWLPSTMEAERCVTECSKYILHMCGNLSWTHRLK